MDTFTYVAPSTVQEAVSILKDSSLRSKPLAGGTDLIVQLKNGAFDSPPEQLVDLKRIPELAAVSYSDQNGLSIGSAVTCAAIRRNELIRREYAAVHDSATLIGGRAIQERATLGGNLCNSSPSADAVPSLIVYRAGCGLLGPEGMREVSVLEFCSGPGSNVMQTDELLVRLTLPPNPGGSGSAYVRFIPRHEMDIAVAGVAALVQLDADGIIADARLALSAVGPTPLVADEAAQLLVGKPAGAETLKSAAAMSAEMCAPISDVRGGDRYRRHLIGVLTRRALECAISRVEERVA